MTCSWLLPTFWSCQKNSVDVFNAETSCLVVQDEPPRNHSIGPTRGLDDAAEGEEVDFLEPRLRIGTLILRERRDHLVGRLRAQEIGHRTRAGRKHTHGSAHAAKHREFRELP